MQQEAESERGKTGPQVAVQGGYLYQQDRYVEPNGVAGVMVGVEWNALDMGRAASPGQRIMRQGRTIVRLRRDAETMIALEVRQRWLGWKRPRT